MVFYTAGKCYEFRILNANGAIEGTQLIFYTREAALTAALSIIDEWVGVTTMAAIAPQGNRI